MPLGGLRCGCFGSLLVSCCPSGGRFLSWFSGFSAKSLIFFEKSSMRNIPERHTGLTTGLRDKLPVASATNYPWQARQTTRERPPKIGVIHRIWRFASASATNYPWITSKKTQVIHRLGGSPRQAPQTSRSLMGYASGGGSKLNICALGISIGGAKVGGELPTSTANR